MKPSFRAALIACCAILPASPHLLEAREVRPAPAMQVSVEMPDSVCGVTRTCIDVRTGTPFSHFAHRLTTVGQIDTSWVADSASLCLTSIQALVPTSVSDGNGGVIFAWVDSRSGGSDIYATRLLASGEQAEGWPAEGLPVCPTSHTQSQVSIARDGTGGAFIAWQEYRALGVPNVFLQRVTSAGAIAEGWPTDALAISAQGVEQAEPRLTEDGAGGVFVSWLSRETPLGADQLAIAAPRGVLNRRSPGSMGLRLAEATPYASWVSSLGLQVIRIGPTGAAGGGWPAGGVRMASPATAGRLVSDGNGGMFVAWRERDGAASRLRLNRLSADGAIAAGWDPAGSVVAEFAGVISDPTLQVGANGDALLAWTEQQALSGALRAQRVHGSGQVAQGWPALGLEIATAGVVGEPTLLSVGDGGIVIAWEDVRGGHRDISARRLDSDATASDGWPTSGVPVCDASGDQYRPTLRSDGAGGVVAIWSDASIDALAGIAGGRRSGLALLELKEVRAMPHVVRLRWAANIMSAAVINLYRDGGDGWTLLQALTPAANALTYQDRDVEPGETVTYRLGILDGDIEYMQQSISVEIPLAPTTLELSHARAVPGEGAIRFGLAVPGQAPVKVELMDIAGRRVASERLQALEIGEHELRLAAPRIAPGVYFLRVSQGRIARSAKLVYLR